MIFLQTAASLCQLLTPNPCTIIAQEKAPGFRGTMQWDVSEIRETIAKN